MIRNWLFGWYMVEYEQQGADRAEYGAHLVNRLSDALGKQMGRGFSARSLEQCRKFYMTQKQISQTVSAEFSPRDKAAAAQKCLPITPGMLALPTGAVFKPDDWQDIVAHLLQRFSLGWSHDVTLLTIDNYDERCFYEIEAAQNHWSVRELERQIKSSLYERLALSRNKEEIRRLAQQGLVVEKATDLIKNPLVLEFLNLEEKPAWSESDLELAIIDRLETFLLELGKGFLFEARQKRFTFDNDHFYIDLVFYNRLLRCYVLIDLKRDKLTHQDLGQMQMYVNYFAPKYQLYLPSKTELKAQLEKITQELEGGAHA